MSRVLSFRDLQRIPALAKYTESELLGIEMDEKINKCLAALGFDVRQPILYVPTIHRDMAGKVAMGFRAVGEIDPYNREYLNSRVADPVEWLIASSKTDMSLARELSQMMGAGICWSDDNGTENDDFPDELIEESFGADASAILILERMRDQVRGTPYNEAGALKTPEEYQEAVHG